MERWILLTVLAALLCLAAACGSSDKDTLSLASGGAANTITQGEVGTETDLPFDLPAIPQDEWSAEAERNATVVNNLIIGGTNVVATNGVPVFPNSNLLFPEDAEDFRYAMYRLPNINPDSTINSISAVFEDYSEGAEAYFAFANYSANRWDFSSNSKTGDGPYSFNLTDDFDTAMHLSAAFNAYLVIVVAGAPDFAEIDYINLVTDTDSAVVPRRFNASDGLEENRVQLFWDAFLNVDEIEVWYKLASEDDTQYALLRTLEGDETFTYHNDDDDPACLYDVEYEYRIRGKVGSEFTEFSPSDIGYRKTARPFGLVASDGWFEEFVRVYWPRQFVSSYTFDIYRDGIAIEEDYDPLTAPEGDHFFYNDTTATPGMVHNYFVVAVSDQGDSEPSVSDTGCVGDFPGEYKVSSGDSGDRYYPDMEFIQGDGGASSIVGVAYFDEFAGEFRFETNDGQPFGQDNTTIGEGRTFNSLALVNDGGPRVAFANEDTQTLEGQGIYFAYTQILDPVPEDDNDWTVDLVEAANISGATVAMEKIDQKLHLSYITFIAGTGLIWRYAVLDPDAPFPGNWDISTIKTSSVGEPEPPDFFRLFEFNGLPAIMYQGDSPTDESDPGIWIMYASEAWPKGPEDWTEYPAVNAEGTGWGSGKGLDVVINDGRIEYAAVFGGRETSGGLIAGSASLQMPTSTSHWLSTLITTFDDTEIGPPEFKYFDGRPFISVSSEAHPLPRVFTFGFGVLGVEQSLVPPFSDFGFYSSEWLEFQLGVPDEDSLGSFDHCPILLFDDNLWQLSSIDVDGGTQDLVIESIKLKPQSQN